jgi:hypothetical protein
MTQLRAMLKAFCIRVRSATHLSYLFQKWRQLFDKVSDGINSYIHSSCILKHEIPPISVGMNIAQVQKKIVITQVLLRFRSFGNEKISPALSTL